MQTATDFEELFDPEQPTLIDFYADWCGPCRTIAPVVESLAEEYKGRARVVKVNVDESPDLAQAFGVMSIPTLVVTDNDGEISRVTGAVPAHVLREMLDQALKN